MTEFFCCWCGCGAPVVARYSDVRRVFCDGFQPRRPHPPSNILFEPIEWHDDAKAHPLTIQVVVYDIDANAKYYASYLEYLKRRNGDGLPRPADKDNRHTKSRQDINRPNFKCLMCGKKAQLNRRASTYNGITNPQDRIHSYTCKNEKVHKTVTFKVKRVVLDPEKKDPRGLLFEIPWERALQWRDWVQQYFEMKLKALPVR